MLTRRRLLSLPVGLGAAALAARSNEALSQAAGTIVFVSRRPPREMRGSIRAWANANSARAYNEDTSAHLWRVQFMAFLPRSPNSSDVTLVFYKIEGRQRRYISNESITLSSPGEQVFYHQTVLHRGADEFQPMENYEAAIAVSDARGQRELARGRIGLVGVVERHQGVVDFTGTGGPTVR